MLDKRVTDLPLAVLWQDYRAAQRVATAAHELHCSLKTANGAMRPQYPIAFAQTPSGPSIHIPTASIEHRIAEADREWRAALQHLDRTRDAVATAPIRLHADAMIKARFLNEAIEDTLGEPWDTVWWQLKEWLS